MQVFSKWRLQHTYSQVAVVLVECHKVHGHVRAEPKFLYDNFIKIPLDELFEVETRS